jgi:hypothetical protein
LTKADRAKRKALAARLDSEIDSSDIEMTDEQWKMSSVDIFIARAMVNCRQPHTISNRNSGNAAR